MNIKAIETSYAGYRFRSRLEARWAVFLDALGCQWRYEPQGFDLDGEMYLPDFFIPLAGQNSRPYQEGIPPTAGFWVEIKPTEPTEREKDLCSRLSRGTRHVVYLVYGSVGDMEFDAYKFHHSRVEGQHCKSDRDRCRHCGSSNAFLFYLVAEAIPDSTSYRFDRLDGAFQKARSARFEHGETPGRTP